MSGTLEKFPTGVAIAGDSASIPGVADAEALTETKSARDFSDFYRDSYGPLVAQAFLLVGNLSDAQELAQDALLKAWRRWEVPPPLEDPVKWVRVVMHRQAIASWRRRTVTRRFAHRLSEPDQTSMPVEHLEVAQAARSLPPNQRRVLVLQAVLGMSVEEIASEMGAPESTVRTWLSRARRRMSQLLEIADEEEGSKGT